ncbi:MAG: AsmA family protein [Magnetococcales bacterium]|nr:AsmA family protein [Magnetococcales bacterium]
MHRVLKGWLYGVGGLVAALVALALAVPWLVHPNQYRAPIAALVENLTGRQLTIRGDLGLELFPRARLILRDAELADKPGFGDGPMVRLRTLEAGVHVIPLLHGQLEVELARVTGVTVNLRRNEAGVANWEDLYGHLRAALVAGDRAPAAESASPESAFLKSIKVGGGVEVAGATILWRDPELGADARIDDLEVKTGRVVPGQPVSLTLGLRFREERRRMKGNAEMKGWLRPAPGTLALDGFEVRAKVAASGGLVKEATMHFTGDLLANVRENLLLATRTALDLHVWSDSAWWRAVALGARGDARADLTARAVKVSGAQLSALVKANDLPPAGVRVQVGAELGLDWPQRILTLEELTAEGPGGLKANGELTATHWPAAPRTTGSLTVERFDLRSLLIALGRTIPVTGDGATCTRVEGEVEFATGPQGVEIPRLVLEMDDSRFTGALTVGPAPFPLSFDGQVDTLDLDRYLPLLDAVGLSADKLAVLPAWLSGAVPASGTLRAGRMTLDGRSVVDLAAKATGGSGLVTLESLTLGLHGGRVEGKATLDRREAIPALHLETVAKGVRAGPLLRDLAALEGASGMVEWDLRLDARGGDREAMIPSMSGALRLVARDGVIPGADVAGRIRNAYATYNRLRAPAAGTEETRFTEAAIGAVMRNGVLLGKDLAVQGQGVKIGGGGLIDFVQRRLDLQLAADVATSLRGMAPDAEQYQGLELPIQLRGAFDAAKKWEWGNVDFSRVRGKSTREWPAEEERGRSAAGQETTLGDPLFR